MNRHDLSRCFTLFLMLVVLPSHAQFALQSGGFVSSAGASTGSVYTVSGSLAPHRTEPMSGGSFTIQGGRLSGTAAVQTPGAPLLQISRSNSVLLVSWRQSAGWRLEYSTNFHSTRAVSWQLVPAPYPIAGTNAVVPVTEFPGARFYRLRRL